MMGNYHVRFGGQGNQSSDPDFISYVLFTEIQNVLLQLVLLIFY